jgi:hypothetical protein
MGRFGQKLIPNLEERVYKRGRRKEALARGSKYPLEPKQPRKIGDIDQSHVVVVPYEGVSFGEWGPAQGNFYFEAAENLRDRIGGERVSIFDVSPGTSYKEWHIDLVDYLNDVRATHFLAHAESDPASQGASWTWDSAVPLLDKHWGGAFLGVNFDSAHKYINFNSRILARQSPNFLNVDIATFRDGELVSGRPEVGPVNRPFCEETLQIVRDETTKVESRYDLVFLGAPYPYRLDLLRRIESMGIEVVVNPHKNTGKTGTSDPMQVAPDWLSYMRGLASARATLNFSESSALGGTQQLKWRVIESGIANTFLFTDDWNLTAHFWPIETFARFKDEEDLPRVANSWFTNLSRMEDAKREFGSRAYDLARYGFWAKIEAKLTERGLKSIDPSLIFDSI